MFLCVLRLNKQEEKIAKDKRGCLVPLKIYMQEQKRFWLVFKYCNSGDSWIPTELTEYEAGKDTENYYCKWLTSFFFISLPETGKEIQTE